MSRHTESRVRLGIIYNEPAIRMRMTAIFYILGRRRSHNNQIGKSKSKMSVRELNTANDKKAAP